MRRKELSQPKKKNRRDRDRDATVGEDLTREQKQQQQQRRNKSSPALQRSIRSNKGFGSRHTMMPQQLRSGDLSASLSMLSKMNYPGLMMTNAAAAGEANETVAAVDSKPMVVDLNPDLCYQVGGLSNGQKKLCVQSTDIMPAISRGARAAIQVSDSANL